MDGDELSRTFCGSTVYAAPEILASSEDYNAFYSDVWSCGIILYAMFTAKLPFNREKLTLFTQSTVVEGNFDYIKRIRVQADGTKGSKWTVARKLAEFSIWVVHFTLNVRNLPL